jgi:DNA polymerase-1
VYSLEENPKPILDLDSFLLGAATADAIGLDFESNGQDCRDGTGYTVGCSISYCLKGEGFVAHYLPFRHKYGYNLARDIWLPKLKSVLEQRTKEGRVTATHSNKADIVFADSLGIDIRGPGLICTLEMTHLINEVVPYSKKLSACAKHYLNDEGKKESKEFTTLRDKIGWHAIPSEEMWNYARYDAYLHLLLYSTLKPKWDKEQLSEYWPRKARTTNIVIEMERRGVKIDVPLCEREAAIGHTQMDELVDLLGFNPGSPKQLGKFLIDELGLPVVKRTPGGNPSFDKFAMEEYDQILERRDDSRAQHVLMYRGWQKAVTSNYEPYVKLLSPDGRLRPNYKLHGTKTGRMSCEKPNLQQIPKVSEKPWNGHMKSAFLGRPGYSLWEADYGQLELRLATAYAKEQSLLDVFNEGRDIFNEMRTATGLVRHDQKTLVYTIQYGGGVRRVSNVFGVSEARAKQLIESYYRAYPNFRKLSYMAASQVKAKGKIRLWSGRYRHFQWPKDEAHKAFNSVIQGGAADIVEGTMDRLFREVDEEDKCMMLLQVHDSVVFEIRDDLVDLYRPKIVEVMENVEPDFGVKFSVDFHKWGS